MQGITLADEDTAHKSFTTVVQRTILLCFIVFFLAEDVVAGLSVAGHLSSPLTWTPIVPLLAAQLFSLVDLSTPRGSIAAVCAGVACTVVGVCLSLMFHTPPSPGEQWWLTPHLYAFALALVSSPLASMAMRVGAPLMFAVAQSALMFSTGPVGLVDWRPAVLATVMFLPAFVGVALVIPVFRRHAVSADAAHASLLTRTRRGVSVKEEESRLVRAGQFIHDEVMTTLRVISMDRDVVSADQARREAATLVANLEPGGSLSTKTRLTTDLRDEVEGWHHLGISVRVSMSSPAMLPFHVAETLSNATSEAIRNAAEHSGAPIVDVEIKTKAGRTTVRISDSGRGFDATTRPHGHYGLDGSIVGPVERIGGTAVVTSEIGVGTTVELSWCTLDQVVKGTTGGWLGSTTSEAKRSLHWYGRAVTFATLVATLLLVTTIAHPLIALAWLAVVAVSFEWGIHHVGKHGLKRSAVFLFAGLSAATGFLAAWTVGGAYTEPTFNTMAGSAGLFALLVATRRRLWPTVVGCCGALIGGGLGIAMSVAALPAGEAAPMTGYLPALISPFFLAVAGRSVWAVVERYGHRVITSQEALVASARRHDTAHSVYGAVLQHLNSVADTVCPFVQAVADGYLDPDEKPVRDRALMLERTLREGHGLSRYPLLAKTLSDYRGKGWHVVSRLGEALPVTLDGPLTRFAELVGSAVGPPPQDAGQTPTVQLVVMPSGPTWRATMHISPLSDEPEFTAHLDGVAYSKTAHGVHLGITVP